jgi:hypothetical protein
MQAGIIMRKTAGDSYVDINEKFCPTCKNLVDRKAVACVYCGSLFDVNPSRSVLMTKKTNVLTAPTAELVNLYVDAALLPEKGIALYTEGVTEPVCLDFEGELVLGRDGVDADGIPEDNLLNLSELGGYLMGISRRHAVIRRTACGYEIIDLASTNGSWLNGIKLTPNRPYPLVNGSQLRFGRMRVLVLYRDASRVRAAD